MSFNNPLVNIRITLDKRDVKGKLVNVIMLLTRANVLTYVEGMGRAPVNGNKIVLDLTPPKGTTNNLFWAEQVVKRCEGLALELEIVRKGDL